MSLMRFSPAVCAALLLLSCAPPESVTRKIAPETDPSPPQPQAWVDSVLATMTLEQKVAQLIMVRVPGHYLARYAEESGRLERLVGPEGVGGLLLGEGDVYESAYELNRLQQASRLPLLVAADFERGAAMRVRRSTFIGEAMAIGATRDTTLAYRAGKATAEEARALGVQMNFAPVADINSNPENPVINTRSFGDDRVLVGDMVSAYIRGTGEAKVAATVKHFPGHGDTETDSHIALPVLKLSEARIDSVELSTFRRAIAAGAGSVMIAHLAVPSLDPVFRGPASLSPRLIDSLLVRHLGFEGLVITDALRMQSVAQSYSPGEAAVMAFQAGADILLSPADYPLAIDALLAKIRSGEISMERLDRSVRKILTTKKSLGLDRSRMVDLDRIGEVVASPDHLRLAHDIAQRSITVLRNDHGILPLRLRPDQRIELIAVGDAEDALTEVNRPSSDRTVEPFGEYLLEHLRRRHSAVELDRLSPASNSMNIDSVLLRARRADIVIVAMYVKAHAGFGSIDSPTNLTRFLKSIQSRDHPLIVLDLGNPYLMALFPHAHALVCSYCDAEYSVEASVQALFGEIPVGGRLPVSVSPSLRFGSGIDLPQTVLRIEEPFAAGFDPLKLLRVGDVVWGAIRDSAFPGAQVAIIRNGVLVYDRAFGSLTYDPAAGEVTRSTRYDLASLTKVVVTTSSIMKLCDRGKLFLEDTVSHFLPKFSGGQKGGITIRQLLMHRGGLPPFRKLWEICRTPEEALDTVYGTQLVAPPGDTTIYSDFSMIILGKVVEKISGMPLDEFAEKEFFRPLGMTSTGFIPPAGERDLIAPTEFDSSWRKRLVQGTVHDENAAFFGGVSGHAGLFSTASDLAVFMQMLLNGGTYGGVRFLSDSIVRAFTTRRDGSSERALGWDLKAPSGSSAGDLFSPSSYGHTGFTGTSIWVDPLRRLCVIFLANRVYPTRANLRIAHVRPLLHDAVVWAMTDDTVTH